jgi:type I restriction enzyme S subunit
VLKYAFEGKLTEEWREAHKGEIEPASILLERIKEERKKKAKGKYKELPPLDVEDLSELPGGWVWTMLGDIGTVAAGGTPSTNVPENFNGNIPWVTPADLSEFDGKFINRGARNISEKGLNSSSAVLLPAGTILFSSRAPIGYVAIAANPISTNQGFKNLTCCEYIFNEYVFYYLKASRNLAESYGSGTTFREVSASRFAKIPFPLPPLPEQQKIVEEIERCLSVADETEKAVVQSLKQAERLRQSILKKAFEGKLVPQDPTDEPASVLLERIKKERAAEKKSKTKKSKRYEQRRLI